MVAISLCLDLYHLTFPNGESKGFKWPLQLKQFGCPNLKMLPSFERVLCKRAVWRMPNGDLLLEWFCYLSLMHGTMNKSALQVKNTTQSHLRHPKGE